MSGIDIAITVVVAVLFAAALGYMIYRKLRHKGGCDCGGDCGACGGDCHRAEHADHRCGECCCCKDDDPNK